MPVWLRRAAIALGAGLLMLAAGAVWLATQFEPSDHKGVAVAWMKERYDRTLGVDGPISLSLFPRLQIRLAGVRLSERGRSDTFAELDDVALSVELLPLLRRRLAVDRVEARGLRLVLLRDAAGRRNIDDLLQPGAPAGRGAERAVGAASAAGGDAALSFDVNRILLADVQARVKDEAAGIDGELVIRELSTGRIASNFESALSVVAQFGFKSPALKGTLSGSTRFTPELATGSVSLSDMNLVYKGDAPGASSIDALLKGSLGWDGHTAALAGKALSLRVTANAAGLRLVGSTLSVDRVALDPARRAFAMSQLQLRLKGSQGGKPLALDMDWPELDVTGDTLVGSTLAGKLSLGAPAPLEVTFKSGAPGGNFDNLRVPALEARIHSAAAERRLVGGLRGELVLQRGTGAAQLERIELQLKMDEPGMKPLALRLEGNASAAAGTARWSVAGELNGNRFDSGGSAGFAGITPTVKTQLRFETLDLNALLQPPSGGSASVGGGSAATPIDLDLLRKVNGSLALRVGRLALRQYRASEVTVDATLDAGMLRVSALRGQAWGGVLAGSAFADARASRLAFKGVAEGIDMRALLKDVADQELLEGSGSIEVDMETAGRQVAELKSRLKGRAALRLRDGAVKGVNLARTLRQAKAALKLKQDAMLKAVKTEKTDFSELNASFVIDAGVARSTDVELKSPYLRLDGTGSVDVVRGRLDSVIRAVLTDTSKGQDGADLSALDGVAVPVQLSGPFDAVAWKLQWSDVVATALKTEAAAALETRLKDKLRRKVAPKTAPGPAPAASTAPSAKDMLENKLKGLLP